MTGACWREDSGKSRSFGATQTQVGVLSITYWLCVKRDSFLIGNVGIVIVPAWIETTSEPNTEASAGYS